MQDREIEAIEEIEKLQQRMRDMLALQGKWAEIADAKDLEVWTAIKWLSHGLAVAFGFITALMFHIMFMH